MKIYYTQYTQQDKDVAQQFLNWRAANSKYEFWDFSSSELRDFIKTLPQTALVQVLAAMGQHWGPNVKELLKAIVEDRFYIDPMKEE